MIRRTLLAPVLGPVLAVAMTTALAGCAGSAQKSADIVVPPGATLTRAARIMEDAGVIDSADRFLTQAKLTGGGAPIKPGEYRITKGMSSGDILKLLQSGKTLQRLFAVPEGLPAIMVAEKLAADPMLTGPAPDIAEGSVLPDSYAFTRGESRAAVVKRMQAAMDRTLKDAWTSRSPAAQVKTPREALILASIVEKETGIAADRPMVSAVYNNRLRIGMPLQADPTVIYPVTKGKPLGRRILRSELDANNPWNTYRNNGLPPGPITNPGAAAIRATLNPAKSDALYFVAKGDGSSVFATTLDEHNRNVAAWYALRRQRGEM